MTQTEKDNGNVHGLHTGNGVHNLRAVSLADIDEAPLISNSTQTLHAHLLNYCNGLNDMLEAIRALLRGGAITAQIHDDYRSEYAAYWLEDNKWRAL